MVQHLRCQGLSIDLGFQEGVSLWGGNPDPASETLGPPLTEWKGYSEYLFWGL